MNIGAILSQRESGVSFEFFPPKTEKGMEKLRTLAQTVKKYDPLYLSMTYGAGGTSQERTKAAVDMLLELGGVEVMPHLTCIGAQISRINELLAGYATAGIENIMALRGDPPQDEPEFDVKPHDLSYALDLVQLIKRDHAQFGVGVAVYPEGHIQTRSLEEDVGYAQAKIDAGADFAVTQMFFDNRYFYQLIERMNKKGIAVPVMPGILPLTDVSKVKQFASVCRTTVPVHIQEAMEQFRDKPDEMAKIGLDFTIAQCQDLIDQGFRRLHFFTLNKLSVITTVLDALSFEGGVVKNP